MSSTTTVTTTEKGAEPTPSRPTRKLHRIPRPENLEAQQRWQLEQMAAAFRIFAKLGYADGGSGHISLRGMPSQISPYRKVHSNSTI